MRKVCSCLEFRFCSFHSNFVLFRYRFTEISIHSVWFHEFCKKKVHRPLTSWLTFAPNLGQIGQPETILQHRLQKRHHNLQISSKKRSWKLYVFEQRVFPAVFFAITVKLLLYFRCKMHSLTCIAHMLTMKKQLARPPCIWRGQFCLRVWTFWVFFCQITDRYNDSFISKECHRSLR
jgi:hypothetical protein